MSKKFVFLGKVILAVMLVLAFVGCPDPGGNIGNVNKEAGATVAAPSGTTSVTHNSITIVAVAAPGNGQAVEYAISTTNSAPSLGWQDGLTFNGLSSDTTYYIFARGKENSTLYAGAASSGYVVKTDVIMPLTVIVISAGGENTLAIKQDGTLWAWGRNGVGGRLGDGTTITRILPIQIGIESNWVHISPGGQHSLAIKTDGSLWAWGSNGSGQLGNGTNIDRLIPIQSSSDNNWAIISAGGAHSLAIKTDGSLWAWGWNNSGQLGDGSYTANNNPIQIGIDNNWSTISAGGTHSLAIKTDGSLWAWGARSAGQLGDGINTLFDRNTPFRIGTENDWAFISTGFNHSLAIKTDGSLWAWGENFRGQLGDGTNIDRYTPIRIGSDNTWTYVSAGADHSLAIKTDGSLWAWGYNFYGQLGDGTDISRYTPTRIGSDNTWTYVSAGYNHSLAMKNNGSLWACGHNPYGQLGNGSYTSSQQYVQILP